MQLASTAALIRLPCWPAGLQDFEPADPFVAAVGRRLTGLRQLTLRGLRHTSEPALETLGGEPQRRADFTLAPPGCTTAAGLTPCRPTAGLGQLTALTVLDAHTFGGRALVALQPLRQLQRLCITNPSLDAASLYSALADADLAEAAEGDVAPYRTEGEPLFLPDLGPALTCLQLHECRMLGCVVVCLARLPCECGLSVAGALRRNHNSLRACLQALQLCATRPKLPFPEAAAAPRRAAPAVAALAAGDAGLPPPAAAADQLAARRCAAGWGGAGGAAGACG